MLSYFELKFEFFIWMVVAEVMRIFLYIISYYYLNLNIGAGGSYILPYSRYKNTLLTIYKIFVPYNVDMECINSNFDTTRLLN